MVINRCHVLVVLISASMFSCSNNHAIQKFETECHITYKAVIVRYKISGGNRNVYLIDAKNIGVRQSDGRLEITLGRQKASESVHYNVFMPPQNIEIRAGQAANGDIAVDIEKYKLKTTDLRSVTLSVMIANDDLLSGQKIIDPHEYFKTVGENAKVYEASCIVHPPASPTPTATPSGA